ncbi:MAG: hypothetical protein HYZ28_00345 [Myxococcales bacterium]|nr:hypothetical protein [Myxococcales bacterium]
MARAAATLGLCGVLLLSCNRMETAERLASRDPELSALLAPAPSGLERQGALLTSPGFREAQRASTSALSAAVPARADQPIEVSVGGRDDFRLRLWPLEAKGAEAALERGRAFFPNAFQSTDLIAVADSERLELLFLLRDADAPAAFAWRVELPAGLARVEELPSGGLGFTDSYGVARIRVPPPFAVDSLGTRREAELSYLDGRLSLRLDSSGLQFPVLLDPGFEVGAWRQAFPATAPFGRRYHAMAYDADAGTAVLFGGESPAGYNSELWEWDGANWRRTSPDGGAWPSNTAYHAMAYDSSRGTVVVFGGASTTTQLWEWRAGGWVNRTPSPLPTDGGWPTGRYLHGLAYDSARKVTVLFGGNDGASQLNDTWEWDGAAWRRRLPASLPPGGPSPRLAYDSLRSKVVMYGAGPSYDQTWEWDGNNWAQFDGGGPGSRYYFEMAFDSSRSRTVLFGGPTGVNDTWEFDGTRWVRRNAGGSGAPPYRYGLAMAHHAARKRTVMFGGYRSATYYSDTWELYSRGGPCATAADCVTPYCTDGVCCEDQTCTGLCRSCDNGRNPGVCDLHLAGDQDPDSCTGTQACDSAGVCKLAAAQSCTSSSNCASGYCVDGVCCRTSCWTTSYPCVSCTQPGQVGTCVWMTNVEDTEGAVLCSGFGRCDADAGCNYYNGQYCSSAGRCLSQQCVDSACCSQASCPGVCRSCAYPDAGTCATVVGGMQDPDSCTGVNACDSSGQCKIRAGQPCDAGSSCSTGYCVDGVCCWQFGCGLCEACNLPPDAGVCRSVRNAQDPDTCAVTRACSSFGACLDFNGQPCDAGTSCASGLCTDGVCCASICGLCRTCNGADAGNCQPVVNAPDPDSCSGTRICDGTATCKDLDGQPCATGASCATGNCVDGVCCVQSSCPGQCYSCKTSATPGFCGPVVPGQPDQKSCNGTRSCDSSGQCLDGNGQPCDGGQSCGSGACVDGVCCEKASCAPCQACNLPADAGYCLPVRGTVDPDSCSGALTCSAQGECRSVKGRSCDGGQICASNFCVDGVCCDRASCGSCQACNLPADAGSCTPVRGAVDPDSCYGDRTCTSTGVCRSQIGRPCQSFLDCASGFCVDGVCCEGACDQGCQRCNLAGSMGLCRAVPAGEQSPRCAPYVCTGAAACPQSCANDQGCVGGNSYCEGGQCIAALQKGAPCSRAQQCTSGFCTDGVCCDQACDQGCGVCAKASGARVDGECAIRPAGQVCRASAGECDLPEACSGGTATCPEDGFEPEGKLCAGGVCKSGKCVAPGSDQADAFSCGCSSGPVALLWAALASCVACVGRRRHSDGAPSGGLHRPPGRWARAQSRAHFGLAESQNVVGDVNVVGSHVAVAVAVAVNAHVVEMTLDQGENV